MLIFITMSALFSQGVDHIYFFAVFYHEKNFKPFRRKLPRDFAQKVSDIVPDITHQNQQATQILTDVSKYLYFANSSGRIEWASNTVADTWPCLDSNSNSMWCVLFSYEVY